MSNKDVKQDVLDNLADALTEDILNTPDHELLCEVEEDYGDPRVLANKFDQILKRAEKQVFGTAHSAASPQVRSSAFDLPINLADETIRAKGIFALGSRISEFLSSLTPRTLAWSATAAAVAVLLLVAVITVGVKEQGAPSEQWLATPGVSQSASLGRKADQLPMGPMQASRTDAGAQIPAFQPLPPASLPTRKLSDEEIAALLKAGRELIEARKIPTARLVLQRAASAGSAAAALELGATYDPITLKELGVALQQTQRSGDGRGVAAKNQQPADGNSSDTTLSPDIAMARAWYEKAREFGSSEAAARLEGLAGRQ